MSDRIPGSSYDNPIWYRGKWRVYLNDCAFGGAYAYVHDDYDGAEDARDCRYGYAETIEKCKAEIDEIEAVIQEQEAAESQANSQFGVGA